LTGQEPLLWNLWWRLFSGVQKPPHQVGNWFWDRLKAALEKKVKIPAGLKTRLAWLQPEVGTKSVIAITLRYIFALLHDASTRRRKVITSYSYWSGRVEIVIASQLYRFLQLCFLQI
jgi:hypothetical protein